MLRSIKILLDTFTHEFTHHMEKLAPKEWKAYADFVAQKMNEKKAGSFEKAINRRMDDPRREIIADSTRALFEDKNFPKELAQHDVSLARKIADILKRIIAQINRSLRRITCVRRSVRSSQHYGTILTHCRN